MLSTVQGFLQCFDTVGLVIYPVKIVPDMTYNVLSGTLDLAQSINPLSRGFHMFSPAVSQLTGADCPCVNVTSTCDVMSVVVGGRIAEMSP